MYNDDNWHLVEFSREGGGVKLVLDETDVKDGTAGQSSFALDVRVPFFIGGLRPEDSSQIQQSLVSSKKNITYKMYITLSLRVV